MSDYMMNRREFLTASTAATAGIWLAGQPLFAQNAEASAASGPAVAIGVIGLGLQGREIVNTIGRLEGAEVKAICDIYEPYIRRVADAAPGAESTTEYQKILEDKNIPAVIVATPTHQHKQIVLDAIAAGKHVYCESPIAHTIEDAKAIAQAGQASSNVFQVGLQFRADPLHKHVLSFMRTGVPGRLALLESQWNRKFSMRRMAPTPEREKELNWKLYNANCSGILGEVALPQIDMMNWYVGALPESVRADGGVMFWNDGRETADTVQATFLYPGGLKYSCAVTLVNSFGGSHETMYGSEAAIYFKGQKSWMFKEADSAMLGWEVYAKKELVGDETGITLVADATKIIQAGKEPSKEDVDYAKDSLYYSLEEFANNVREGASPSARATEGLTATVTAIKANEALMSGNEVKYEKEWFEV